MKLLILTIFKSDFISIIVYVFAIGFVKASILLMYLRTFTESRRFRWIVYGLLTILIFTHLGIFPLWFVQYLPVDCEWINFETDEQSDAHGCTDHLDMKPFIVCIAALGIIFDFIILGLPCPAIMRLHLPKRQKIGILVIISAGLVYETPSDCDDD